MISLPAFRNGQLFHRERHGRLELGGKPPAPRSLLRPYMHSRALFLHLMHGVVPECYIRYIRYISSVIKYRNDVSDLDLLFLISCAGTRHISSLFVDKTNSKSSTF
jgi:hypothetical protein